MSGLGSWFRLVDGRYSSPTVCSLPQCPFAQWNRVAWKTSGAPAMTDSLRTEVNSGLKGKVVEKLRIPARAQLLDYFQL